MQNHYSLIYREEEREMFPTLKMFGVGSIPWSPLARGILTRPLGQTTKRSETDPCVVVQISLPPFSAFVTRIGLIRLCTEILSTLIRLFKIYDTSHSGTAGIVNR